MKITPITVWATTAANILFSGVFCTVDYNTLSLREFIDELSERYPFLQADGDESANALTPREGLPVPLQVDMFNRDVQAFLKTYTRSNGGAGHQDALATTANQPSEGELEMRGNDETLLGQLTLSISQSMTISLTTKTNADMVDGLIKKQLARRCTIEYFNIDGNQLSGEPFASQGIGAGQTINVELVLKK